MKWPFARRPGGALGPAWALAAVGVLSGCGCGAGDPMGPSVTLGPLPVAISPVAGALVTVDSPTFVVQNAQGYDLGQAAYTIEVVTRGRGVVVASVTVPAGQSTTSASAGALPRGLDLAWRATARSATASVASALETFRMPDVACPTGPTGYARTLVDVSLPVCARAPNKYADASRVLGPPDSGGVAGNYFGFVSLGEMGYVTVDMEGCAADRAGVDVRVFQSVGSEPVTLYAAGTANGPFVLIEFRKVCGLRVPGGTTVNRYCDFDLGAGEVREARYFKIEDGEHYPCADASTDSEGADIDAIQILQPR